jgi:sialic acid synthase SpsE
VSSRDLIVGDEINLNDLDWVRPGGGLSPGSEGKLLGKRLIKNIKKGEIIYLEDVN